MERRIIGGHWACGCRRRTSSNSRASVDSAIARLATGAFLVLQTIHFRALWFVTRCTYGGRWERVGRRNARPPGHDLCTRPSGYRLLRPFGPAPQYYKRIAESGCGRQSHRLDECYGFLLQRCQFVGMASSETR